MLRGIIIFALALVSVSPCLAQSIGVSATVLAPADTGLFVPVQYLNVKEAIQVLNASLTTGIEIREVERNGKSGVLIRTDRTEVRSQAYKLLQQIDVRRPTVSVAARFIAINETDLEALGVQIQSRQEGERGERRWVVDLSPVETPRQLWSRAYDLRALRAQHRLQELADSRATVAIDRFIEILTESELGSDVGQPVVTTLVDKPAEVQVGETFHMPGSGEQTEAIRVGASLNFIASVTKDGDIRLRAKASYSTGTLAEDGSLRKSESSVSTEEILPPGQTLLIHAPETRVSRPRGRLEWPLIQLPVGMRQYQQGPTIQYTRGLLVLIQPSLVQP